MSDRHRFSFSATQMYDFEKILDEFDIEMDCVDWQALEVFSLLLSSMARGVTDRDRAALMSILGERN